MQEWTWALIVILACGGLGLAGAQAWLDSKRERGYRVWERLTQHRRAHDRPRMRSSDDSR